MLVCTGPNTPAGWVRVNDEWDPSRCGHPSSIVNNRTYIHRIASFETVLEICADQAVPGWTVVQTSWNSGKCGHPTLPMQNVWTIRRR